MFNARMPKRAKTTVQLNGITCGAIRPLPTVQWAAARATNAQSRHLPRLYKTLDELLRALDKARSGDVVFVSPRTTIDCTERVYIEGLVIEIPDRRHACQQSGAKQRARRDDRQRHLDTRPLIHAGGPNVRVTGLRIRGPNPKPCLEHHHRSFAEGRGHGYYYKFPTSNGIATEHDHLEVDNCELAGWSHAAIFLTCGYGHFIHHNFIHHNQYNGLGYGISHDIAQSLISHNLFNTNRHSIAGTGNSGSGYEACHNIELGQSLSHCFDMHGGRDRKDNTTVAGTWMHIHHNTFRCPKTAVVIRGVPEEQADIHHNWFYQSPHDLSIRSDGNTTSSITSLMACTRRNIAPPRKYDYRVNKKNAPVSSAETGAFALVSLRWY